MERDKNNLPPKLKEELAEAGRKAVAAQKDFENLIRGFTSPIEIFDKIFWLMFEGVEVKQSEAVNNLLAQIAEPVKPGSRSRAYGNAYEVIRKFYLTGATDADRRGVAKALRENYLFQYAKRHHGGKDAGEKTPALEVETIEELHRRYTEARRWLAENRPAIDAARNRLRATGAELAALQERVREIEKAESLGEAGREIRKQIDRALRGVETLIKRGDKIDRERERLHREITAAEDAAEKAADAAPVAGPSESPRKAGESESAGKKQIPKLF